MVAARPSNSTETQMAGRVRVRITRGSGGGKDTLFVTAMAISDPSRSGAGAARRAVRAVLRCFSPRRLAGTAAFLGGLARQVRRRRAEPRLTVAVDIDSLYETLTGVGWYLYEILDHLARRDDLRLRLYGQGLAPAATPGGAGGPLLPSLASPLAPILALPARARRPVAPACRAVADGRRPQPRSFRSELPVAAAVPFRRRRARRGHSRSRLPPAAVGGAARHRPRAGREARANAARGRPAAHRQPGGGR